jgi:glycosyltransferase involved in cell wall biosynthesis
MRIALVSTVSAPVCKDAWGSVEAWTWVLTRELRRLGHEVTVFGCAGSEAEGEVVITVPGPYGAPGCYDDWELCEWINLCRAVEQSNRFDVLHSQAYLWGIPLEKLSRAPMLHTTHIVPDNNTIRLWEFSPGSHVTAISRAQWSCCPNLEPAAVIPHAVDISQFTFREQPEDYVLYLGRFTSGKGPIEAIQTARALGLRLVMAGPDDRYFREQVQPLIDGKSVEYVGYAGPAERDKLLGGARALLYPIQYAEAFGLVLVEAMLCGTPIAAMNYGAVPEVIEEGLSGFAATTPEEFATIVPKCFGLERRRIRERAEERFSIERMARDYANVYEKVCAGEPVASQ